MSLADAGGGERRVWLDWFCSTCPRLSPPAFAKMYVKLFVCGHVAGGRRRELTGASELQQVHCRDYCRDSYL